MRAQSTIVLLVLGGLSLPAAAAAGPDITPAATLAPACEAFITDVYKKVAPELLPIKVLGDPAPKVGRYVPTNKAGKVGGVKISTVLTGIVEYQDGAARNTAPIFCIGAGKKVGYFYASRPSATVEDRPIVPVQQCYQQFKGNQAGASTCIKEILARSDSDLQAALEAAKAKATAAGGEEPKNLDASQQEFVAYRARSCDMFKAPDASTDAMDFLDACLARLNVMRAQKLSGAPAVE